MIKSVSQEEMKRSLKEIFGDFDKPGKKGKIKVVHRKIDEPFEPSNK